MHKIPPKSPSDATSDRKSSTFTLRARIPRRLCTISKTEYLLALFGADHKAFGNNSNCCITRISARGI